MLAPVPNWICAHCGAGPDDFGVDGSGASAVMDLGRFFTGFLVVMGIGTLSSFDVEQVLEGGLSRK